ncbi:MAG: class I SAM-dependent methyltransferase [Verrucomicrobiae bacterium]|nr:class I SAM-dependent methyltransferase [Verrucomicrobiae bacterium]
MPTPETSPSELNHLRQTWETLGAEDPLWAVVSHPSKRGGGWNVADFLATGRSDIDRLRSILARHPGTPDRFRHVLDFGCGVGRLTQAWRPHADSVTGVDISEPMIRQAERLAAGHPGIQFLVNVRPDLAALPDGHFDLCFSYICLQHMPWPLARAYLAEFARVCTPGGWLLFQLPSRPPPTAGLARLRQSLVNLLPFGLDRSYRRWKHGSAAVFDVYYTPPDTVIQTATDLGLTFCLRESDPSAGPDTEGFLYLFRRPAGPA